MLQAVATFLAQFPGRQPVKTPADITAYYALVIGAVLIGLGLLLLVVKKLRG